MRKTSALCKQDKYESKHNNSRYLLSIQSTQKNSLPQLKQLTKSSHPLVPHQWHLFLALTNFPLKGTTFTENHTKAKLRN